MKTKSLAACILGAALLFSTKGFTEDIDIFLNPTGTSASAPNLLIVIDSAGSINAQTTDLDGVSRKIYTVAGNVLKALLDPTTLTVKKTVFQATNIVDESASCTRSPAVTTGCTCASYGFANHATDTTLCKLPDEKALRLKNLVQGTNLGVMLFNGTNASGANGNAEKGGYVAFQVSSMSNDTNRNNLISKLADVPTGNSSMYGMSMYETYKYFTGSAASQGFYGNLSYGTNSLIGYDRRACNLNNPNQTCATNATYVSPITANSCTNAVVVIGPGSPDNSALETNTSYLSGIGGTTTAIVTGGNPNYDSNMFDEYARFFNSKDFNTTAEGVQSLQTYTIMNDPSPSDRSIRFMRSAAQVGGGAYFESKNAIDFLEAFATVLTKVQSVNSAFASVALPVSVNVRGTNLNQVYIGMFRPDAAGKTRWYGNMKQYQLKYDASTDEVYLAGGDGARAETTSAQLVRDTAVSFWTQASTFWNFAPSGIPSSGSDSPDGSVVEKGGAAQQARIQFSTKTAQDTRKVYTCIGCANGTNLATTAAAQFTSSNASVTALLDASTVDWVRGQDLQNENSSAAPNATNDVRASLYGDVLHSRPAVINYNRDTTCSSRNDNDVYVYYGANDGMLKATKGGVGTGGGTEAWAFIPSEFISRLDTLYQNSVVVPKQYFVDGSVASYVTYSTTPCTGAAAIQKVDKAYIYSTMRRGGRFLYALDVTPPASSSSAMEPKFLWKISNTTPGFSKLGQTWSEPRVSKLQVQYPGATAASVPVLIFGGGYDAAVEDIPNSSITASTTTSVTTASGTTNRTMGSALYVVHAETGALIWRASSEASNSDCPTNAVCTQVSGITHSIPAEISIVDYNRDSFADRLYFADTGANVWRANIGASDRTSWTVSHLAQLNAARGSEGASTARRKFLYAPDVIQGPAGSNYSLVAIGSGDREQPFDTSVVNRFYTFKDTGAATPTLLTDTNANLLELTSANVGTGVTLGDSSTGWFYTMTQSGEKVVSAPVTLNGVIFFNTNIPRASCGTGLGEARIYALNYLTGKADVFLSDNNTASAYKVVAGGGFLPGGVPVVVDVGGKLREVLVVGPKVTQETGIVQFNRRVRTYWKRGIDQN